MRRKIKLMAERVGFEPTVPVRVHTFQACVLNLEVSLTFAIIIY